MNAGSVVGGAPAWVWVLLAILVALGVRRLRTRVVPAAVALIPGIAFLIWSVAGAVAYAGWAGPATALVTWTGGALLGMLSLSKLPEPPAARLPGGRVRLQGSPLPLLLYLGVFVVRFACGAWAAIRPADAVLATAIGIAVGAAVTARLLIGLARSRAGGAAQVQ